ncbi:hypothetical protein ACF0H5_024139 [Mactra antiquata]
MAIGLNAGCYGHGHDGPDGKPLNIIFRRFLFDGPTTTLSNIPSPTHPNRLTTPFLVLPTQPTHHEIIPTKIHHETTESSTMTSSSTTMTPLVTSPPTTPQFCQNRHSISCGLTFSLVCGSDGKYYANLCMLALGRCDDPALTQASNSVCSG